MHAAFDRWWNGISLRAKITGVTVLLLTFGLTVAGAGTSTVLRTYLVDNVDQQLKSAAQGLPSSLSLSQIANGGTSDPNSAISYYLAAVDANGTVLASNLDTSNQALAPQTSSLTLAHVQTLDSAVTVTNPTGTAQWRLLTFPARVLTTGSTAATDATLVVGLNLRDVNGTIARFTVIFLGFSIAVVVFGAATTQLLVTSAFAPLRDVERTAARFAAGDYSQRLGGATPNTEVGRLNRSLNTMLARIDRAFADRNRTVDQMRRFVGDASHELRTPLVSLRGYAELYRMGAITNPDDVAQAMGRIENEAIRMSALVQDLLELARLDEARPLTLEPVDLLPIAQDAALDASVSAPHRRVSVVVPEPEPLVFTGDTIGVDPAPEIEAGVGAGSVASRSITAGTDAPAEERHPVVAAETMVSGAPSTTTALVSTLASAGARLMRRRRRRGGRGPASAVVEEPTVVPLPEVGPVVMAEEAKLRQVVTNLVGNAMRYTSDDSPIELTVEVDRQGGYGQISIVDHGEGIPPQLREKIFQRFWRADTSRTRDTGGSGLGLAIVAGIVQNHAGHVEVLETSGGGATFRVSIPLAPIDETVVD